MRDVGKAIRLLIEKEIYGQKLILSGGTISYQALFKCISEELNITYPMYKANKKVFLTLVKISTIFQYLGIGTLLFPKMLKTTFDHIVYKNNKSIEQLNLCYKSITSTIKFTNTMMRKIKE